MTDTSNQEKTLTGDASAASPPQETADVSTVSEILTEPELTAVSPPRRVRVGWIAGRDTLEYYSRILKPLAIGLMDELVEVVIFCPQQAEAEDYPCPPLQVVRYGKLQWLIFQTHTLETLVEEVTSRKIETLHALEGCAAPLARDLAKAAGVNYLVSSYAPADVRKIDGMNGRSAGILAAMQPVCDAIKERRVVATDKVHLLRPGVHQVRQATCFDKPSHSAVIIGGGSGMDVAAYDAMLRSFADLRTKHPDCAFFVLGGEAHESHLRMMAEKLHLRNDLTFVDRQPTWQLAGIFKAADIYVAPMPLLRLDMYALLALAAGIVVLSPSDDINDFLIDDQTAIRYRSGNSADLTRQLRKVLEDAKAAQALADRALSYLRSHHSPAVMVSELARIYRQAATVR